MKIDKMIRAGWAGLALVLIIMSGQFVAEAQDGFNSGAAESAIRSYYDSSGEWAGAFHITGFTAMEPIPQGGGRWLVNARYNFVGYGKDYTGANRAGETGWDQRTFSLMGSGGSYTCVGMGGHMSAQFGARAGTNTNAGDQLKSAAAAGGNTRPNFDEGTARSAGHLDAVTVTGNSGQRGVSAVPEKYQKYPEIMRYDQEARRAAAQRDKLDQEIARLEQQGASSTNQAGVELAKKRRERTAAQSSVDAAEINKKEKIRIEETKLQ